MRTSLVENGKNVLNLTLAVRLGNLVGFAQEPDSTVNIVWIPKKNADPS